MPEDQSPPNDSKGAGRSSDASKESKPKQFGKYDVIRVLGKGGMGKVYLGVDRDLKRTVALKFLSKDRATNPILVKRFKSEGQAAANLNHENIVRVFDSGEINGQLYLALEYIEGKDAHQMLAARGRFPVNRSLEIIRKTALALGHASQHGIVHRDIKPANIMIRQDGEIKLADMGLARSLDEDEDAGITRAGTTVGTVDYMSPEQARNSKLADLRSDIYSLGATWYQLLTGQPPFPDGDLTNKLRAHATAKRPDPADSNDQVSESISSVIARMMAINPVDRYQTVDELLEDLAAVKGNRNSVLDAVLGGADQSLPPGSYPDVVTDEDDSGEYEDYEGDFEEEDDDPPASKSRRRRSSGSSGGDVDDVDDEPAGRRGKKKKRSSKEKSNGSASSSASGRGRSASAGTSDDESYEGYDPLDEDDNAKSGKRRKKSRGKSKSVDSTGAASTSKKRTLPPRNESEVVESRKLDPDLIRNIVIGGVILGMLGLIVMFVNSQDGNGEGVVGATVGNPYAVDQSGKPSLANAVVDRSGDDEPTVTDDTIDDGDDTPPVVSAVTSGPSLSAEERAAIDALSSLAPRKGVEFPAWVDRARIGAFVTGDTYEVRDDGVGKRRYSSLAAALRALPSSGGRIVLVDPGPHRLQTTTFRNSGPVSIEGMSDGIRPVIEIVARDEQSPVMDFGYTDLVLQGVDIFLRSEGQPASKRTWFAVDNAGLTVLNCSVTDVSRDADSTVFATTTGRVGSAVSRRYPGRVLMAESSIRGPSTTALSVNSATCDVVVGNCYIDSGRQPSIRYLAAAPKASRRRSGEVQDSRRGLIVGSTIFSESSALEFSTPPLPAPRPVSFQVEQSLLAAMGKTQSDQALVRLAGWPSENEQPATLNIALPDSTLVSWPALVSWRNGEEMTNTSDLTGWRKLFPEFALQSNQLSDVGLERPLLAEVSEDMQSLPGRWREEIAKRVGAELLQADVRRVAWPSEGFGDRFSNLDQWARPADLYEPLFKTVGSVKEYDVKKARLLGGMLEGTAVPDGSEVRIVGKGVIELSDIKLGTKRVRVVCDQSQGGITFRMKTNKRSAAPCFSIAGGELELVNVVFELPAQTGTALPSAIVELAGGTVALRGSRFVDAAADRPLTTVFRGTKTGSRVIATDSLVAGPGAIVDALGADGIELTAHNSALFSGGCIARGASSTFLSQCSARSGRDILEANAASSVRFWADQSILSPTRALVSAENAAVLRAVEWYGFENAIAAGGVTTVRGQTTGPTISASAWNSTWGPAHVGRPRVGAVGSLGVGKPFSELSRADFSVDTALDALRETSSGQPPGVDASKVAPTISSPGASPSETPGKPKRSGLQGF